MTSSKTPRRTRPSTERTEPDRTWAPNTRAKKSPAPAKPKANAEAPRPNGEPSRTNAKPPADAPRATPPNPSGAPPRGATNRVLNDAYRLVDDYLRQGQQMAESIWMPLGAAGGPAFGAPDRFMRAMSDMSLAWMETVQQWTQASGQRPSAPTGSAGPFSAGVPRPAPAPDKPASAAAPATSAAPSQEFSVNFGANGRVTVALELGTLPEGTYEAELTGPDGKKSRAKVRVVVEGGKRR